MQHQGRCMYAVRSPLSTGHFFSTLQGMYHGRIWPGCAGEELRVALEEWQDRRFCCDDSPSRLTTGFLDGNNPIVDIYELKVS